MGGPVGWGQLVWRARLTCHLGILRLMSRGLERRRRDRVEPAAELDDGVAPAGRQWPEGEKSRACDSERRVMRSAATKLTRSGSTSASWAASNIRVRIA